MDMVAAGLTGGIASGKSTILKYFAELGIETFCADQAARAAVQPGSDCLAAIVERYGAQILDEEKRLNRAALREIIFNNASEKAWLEKLIHPEVRDRLYNAAADHQSAYCLLDIPLLSPALRKDYDFLVAIINVSTDYAMQLERLVKRDEISYELAEKIINSQVSDEARAAIADYHIDNNKPGTRDLKRQIQQIHQSLLKRYCQSPKQSHCQ